MLSVVRRQRGGHPGNGSIHICFKIEKFKEKILFPIQKEVILQVEVTAFGEQEKPKREQERIQPEKGKEDIVTEQEERQPHQASRP